MNTSSTNLVLKIRRGSIDSRFNILTIDGIVSFGKSSRGKNLTLHYKKKTLDTLSIFQRSKVKDDEKGRFSVTLHAAELINDIAKNNGKATISFTLNQKLEPENIIEDSVDVELEAHDNLIIPVSDLYRIKPKQQLSSKFRSLAKFSFAQVRLALFRLILACPLNIFANTSNNKTVFSHKIGLAVHNLDHVDRPEKLNFFNKVSKIFNELDFSLICFHHSAALPDAHFEVHDYYHNQKKSWLYALRLAFLPRSEKIKLINTLELATDLKKYHLRAMGNNLREPFVRTEVIQELIGAYYFLKKHKPTRMLLWHHWNSYSIVCEALCDLLRIPVAFTHEGFLAGSIAVDFHGEIGASKPAVLEDFFNLPLSEQDLTDSRNYINTLVEKKLDRKPQSNNNGVFKIIKSASKSYDRTIFYAGVNDWQTGIFPLDGRFKNDQSKHYTGTFDCLHDLCRLAEIHNWLIIFKPHPNTPKSQEFSHPNLITIDFGNIIDLIECTDVTVSTVSSVLYQSFIRGIPTVTVGELPTRLSTNRNPIRSKSDLYDAILTTLNSDLEDRKNEATRHIASLLKYYLSPYDDWSQSLHIRSERDYVRDVFSDTNGN